MMHHLTPPTSMVRRLLVERQQLAVKLPYAFHPCIMYGEPCCGQGEVA
jgi:hypothetical protein